MDWGRGFSIRFETVPGYEHAFTPHPLYDYCLFKYLDIRGEHAWTCNKDPH